jgi:serine kinase of HPr protein (carbohydrate metabolism regulator)
MVKRARWWPTTLVDFYPRVELRLSGRRTAAVRYFMEIRGVGLTLGVPCTAAAQSHPSKSIDLNIHLTWNQDSGYDRLGTKVEFTDILASTSPADHSVAPAETWPSPSRSPRATTA